MKKKSGVGGKNTLIKHFFKLSLGTKKGILMHVEFAAARRETEHL